MNRRVVALFALLVLFASAATAQPSLESLWPNADGLRFSYTYHMADLPAGLDYDGPAYLLLEGFTTTPGGEAQNLLGEHPLAPTKARIEAPALPGLLRAVWLARPDLREALERHRKTGAEVDTWQPLFLHVGYFMKSVDDIQMWQDIWNHPTWTYLDGEPVVGASFTHQLIPELTDDIFLHGTVAAVDATVATANGVYSDAVEVEYLIDMGIGALTDESGVVLGTYHGEYRGHVHYVPNVGPVEMLEEYVPYVWADCGTEDCPDEVTSWLGLATRTQTLSLNQDPVAEATMSWGEFQSMFR